MPYTGYIRGCYDNMLVGSFNQTIVRWYKWIQRDSCHFYNKYEILQLTRPLVTSSQYNSYQNDRYGYSNNQQQLQKSAQNQYFICTCFSNGCNGAEGQHTQNGQLGSWKLTHVDILLSAMLLTIVITYYLVPS